jgi:hypothetical protein
MRQRLPPEPGFARREAKYWLQERCEEEGGIRGKHGFPRESERRAAQPRAQSGEGGIRTLEAGIFPT